MKKRDAARVRAAAAPARRTAAGPAWLGDAILAAGAAALAAVVHRGALAAFFTTDDLILFERVRGLAAFPNTLWRVISGRLWWQALFPAFGVDPHGWHVAGLVLHALATALVYAWARRIGAGRASACFAALVFGTAARARTVVWQVAGTGEVLAAIGLLAVLLLLARGTRRSGWLAAPVHAVALLCKESIALAPLAAVFAPAGERAARLRGLVPVLALSAAIWAVVLFARPGTGSLGGEAYAFGFGAHVLGNLLTYALWSADVLHLTGAVPASLPLPWVLFSAALLAALAVYAWRSGNAVARAALVLWLALVLPVLPLKNAVYEHYVYLARAGFALAMAEALVALACLGAAPAARAKRAAIALAPVALLQLATAALWVSIVSTERLPQTGLPRDSFLRKMEVARNAAGDLERALGGAPAGVVIYSPAGSMVDISSTRGAEVAADTTARLRQQLLAAVTDEGRGLRALVPALERVRFATRPVAADTAELVMANTADGHLVNMGRGVAAHLALAEFWARMGAVADARRHLEDVRALYPGAPGVQPALDALPAPR